jgi:hypothetical protein
MPSIDYKVELVPQPDKLSCWAGSMAMIVGWRDGVSIPPETLANQVGRSLRTSYSWDMLEAVREYYGFLDIALPSNASLYVDVDQWSQWLADCGPLWVTVVGAPSHAIVVHGIDGDGTPEGTTVSINNPWDLNAGFSADAVDFDPFNQGMAYTQTFADFTADFGNLGLADYGSWRVLFISTDPAGGGQ